MRHCGEFGEFYAANYGRIVAMIAGLLGDRHEAEDVAQEAFARALTRWSRLAGYELPEAWVRRVALRIAIDSSRRRRRARATAARLEASSGGGPGGARPGRPPRLPPRWPSPG
ncbi:MAG TPA: sigma factor [Streptosporangiaceae bacterium]